MDPFDARVRPRPARLLFSSPSRLTAAALAVLLAGCAVGPDYVRPAVEVPAAYKEDSGWKPATPQRIDAGQAWWDVYGDPTLSALMAEADVANQSIKQAEAAYRQAHAIADAARAGFFPTVGLNAGANRARTDTNGIRLGDSFSLGLSASWEPDVWGAVRRAVEAGDAGTQASAADLAGARLSIQSTLAQDYLQLRVIDLQRRLYAATTDAYAKSLALVQHQYAAGVALRSDVALAETQLSAAQAQAVDLDATRGQLEHAIAVLTGQSPSTFTLAPLDAASSDAAPLAIPVVPPGLPSALLERRPDIAGAERRMQAANANIGVAQAAFFPQLMLSASGGFNSATIGALFNTPSRVFALGAALAQSVFDGGLRRAHSDQAIAVYDATAAQYKQTVLVGFQQVEDDLSILRVLEGEAVLQARAVAASQLSERLALSQYRAGTVSYLSVVTAQTLSLSNQRTAAQLLGRRLAASVALIAATGGGWRADDLLSFPPPNAARPQAAVDRPARSGS